MFKIACVVFLFVISLLPLASMAYPGQPKEIEIYSFWFPKQKRTTMELPPIDSTMLEFRYDGYCHPTTQIKFTVGSMTYNLVEAIPEFSHSCPGRKIKLLKFVSQDGTKTFDLRLDGLHGIGQTGHIVLRDGDATRTYTPKVISLY